MLLIAIGSLSLAVATALILLAFAAVRKLAGRLHPRWWRPIVLFTLLSIPIHAFVSVPAGLAFLGTKMVGTRGDERDYSGPRIRDDGEWVLQSRDSLRAERDGDVVVDAAVRAAAAATAVGFTSRDGTRLRAFAVEPRIGAPRATVVMVHGLFRCAIELEAVGAMFRDQGCEVVLLELRNHGGSGRGPATFGLRESEDVLAAVTWARGRSAAAAARPLMLFGVSLGTAAVGLAAPQVGRLGGVVVDAPMDDALRTAERMLAAGPEGRARRFAMPQPFLAVTLGAIGIWSGVDLSEVRPGEALATLPPDVPVLVIGGGDDRRMPPATVRAIYDALSQPAGVKEIWIRDGADHGRVWSADPDGYREHIARFVARVLER